MEKVMQKSLKIKITQEITELNRNNVQFYAMLKKLHDYDHQGNQTINQRLQTIRVDIRDKIRALASNIDLLYQMQEKKISVIIAEMSKLQDKDTPSQQYTNRYQQQIRELQEKLEIVQSRNNAIISQNQELKQKNALLIDQIQELSKKPVYTNDTNNGSHQKSFSSLSKRQQGDIVSLQNKLLSNNDLTFHQQRNQRKSKETHKGVKSQQSSFSSALIRQQHSFQPSYGKNEQSNKFGFGCLPRQVEPKLMNRFSDRQKHTNLVSPQKKQLGMSVKKTDQGHRLQFLINNLQQAHETTQTSQRSFNKGYGQHSIHDQSVTGPSRGVVKKFII